MTQYPLNHQNILASFEKIMDGLRHHRAEMMAIQEQFVQNQEEFYQEFSQLIEQQYSSLNHFLEEDKYSSELEKLISFWYKIIGTTHPVAEALYTVLYRRFVGKIVLEDAEDFRSLSTKPRLYLANHQVGIESILFVFVISALGESLVNIVAKIEHQQSWMSQLLSHIYSYPQVKNPELIFYFKRDNPLSMLQLLSDIKKAIKERGNSLLIHVQGTRSLSCRQPVNDLSAAFLDLALELDLPIIPVKFMGGLPVEPLDTRLEFPLNYTYQDYYLGKAIYPEALKTLDNLERKALVLEQLNQLGRHPSTSFPHPCDLNFAREVKLYRERTGVPEIQAVLYKLLEEIPHPTSEVSALLTGLHERLFDAPNTPEGNWLQAFGTWLT